MASATPMYSSALELYYYTTWESPLIHHDSSAGKGTWTQTHMEVFMDLSIKMLTYEIVRIIARIHVTAYAIISSMYNILTRFLARFLVSFILRVQFLLRISASLLANICLLCPSVFTSVYGETFLVQDYFPVRPPPHHRVRHL